MRSTVPRLVGVEIQLTIHLTYWQVTLMTALLVKTWVWGRCSSARKLLVLANFDPETDTTRRRTATIFISRAATTPRCVFRDISSIRKEARRRAILHAMPTAARDIASGQQACPTAQTGDSPEDDPAQRPSTIRQRHIAIARAAPFSRRHGGGIMHAPGTDDPRHHQLPTAHVERDLGHIPSVNPSPRPMEAIETL